MIENVVGNYLDSIEEREFDRPFMALLRARGFWDIHFLHGIFEFGKDFIAKGKDDDGITCQFVFQTKAGNINLAEWHVCRGQIDLLRTNSLAHPAFDRVLLRKAIFVTTGRLIGGAALAAQEYSEHLKQLGELDFTTWDRETLLQFISSTPEIGLAASPHSALLSLLGDIEAGQVQELRLEKFSRLWIDGTQSGPLYRAALEAAVIANRFRVHDRLDLACWVGLSLIRACWARTHGQVPSDIMATTVADLGRDIFRHYAYDLLAICVKEGVEPLDLIREHEMPSSIVTYPVRCIRIAEIFGLLALLESKEKVAETQLAEILDSIIQVNPGIVHPISDRWAVSFIPPLLFLMQIGHSSTVNFILENLVRWVGDHYDSDRLGLAGPYAEPEEELEHFLGYPFEHISRTRRSESYLATIILDLAAIFQNSELYETAINDFLAVGAMLCVIEVDDTSGQYILGGPDIRYEPNMSYMDRWAPQDGWKLAPHHHRAVPSWYCLRIGRGWDHFAISAVLRDRHFLTTCQTFSSAKLA